MNGPVDAIVAEAIHLPPDQRLALARRMLESVEPEASADIEAAWDCEIQERIARYDAGGTKSIPPSKVFAEVDRRLRK